MPHYNLRPEQENILRKMVDAARDNNGHFRHYGNSKFTGVIFDDATKNVAVQFDDLSIFQDQGLISYSKATSTGVVLQAAIDAVRTDFGGSRRRRFLHAVYDLSGGNLLQDVPFRRVMELAKLTEAEADSAYLALAKQKFVDGNSGNEDGPEVCLEAAGLRAVEDEGKHTPFHVAVSAGHGSAIVMGNGNSTSVESKIAIGALDAGALQAQGDQLLAQHEAIRAVLESLTAAVADGKKDDPGWGERLTKIADYGKSLVDFATAAINFASGPK